LHLRDVSITLAQMQLQDILFSQGFGTRRACLALIAQGCVAVAGRVCHDPFEEFSTTALRFSVDGEAWPFVARAYLMLHKPAGFECSQRASAWPSVYTLLPAPLRNRPRRSAAPGVQAVGRLDQDATGLLLLSDDGAFIHRLASPKRHMPKLYQVTTADAVDPRQIEHLLAGVALEGEPRPLRAAACVAAGTHRIDLTLTEGKYHQVKRMIAAVGNHVALLHRARIGGLALPADLAPGQWRWLGADELEQAMASGQTIGCEGTGL
jgi:16S rRNA pseudouridine516 synthase